MSGLIWIDVVSIVMALCLATIALRRGAGKPAHRYLCWLCLAAIVYSLSQIGYHAVDPAMGRLTCIRFGFSGAFLLLPCLLHLPAAIVGAGPPPAPIANLVWGATLVFIPLAFTEPFLTVDPATGLVGRAGPLFVVCLPFFVFCGIHFFGTLIREMVTTTHAASRNRVAWVLVGGACWIITAVPDVLRRLDVIDLFGSPVAAVGVMSFLVLTAYAVLRHRLLDIEVVVSRGIVYSTLIPMLAVLYLAAGESVEWVTANIVQSSSMTGGVFCALVVAACFEPAKRMIQRRLDRYFITNMEMLDRVRRLENVSALVVAEDVGALRALQLELTWIVEKVQGDRGADSSDQGTVANG